MCVVLAVVLFQLDEYSNKIANFLLSAGFKHGQSIALYMENRPEYVGAWLGCCKIGLVPALINFNLRGQSLIHSIMAASCVAVIYGTELTQGVYLPVLRSRIGSVAKSLTVE